MPDMNVDKCCITHFPSPVLGGVAVPVDAVGDDIRRLVDRMIDVMIESCGSADWRRLAYLYRFRGWNEGKRQGVYQSRS